MVGLAEALDFIQAWTRAANLSDRGESRRGAIVVDAEEPCQRRPPSARGSRRCRDDLAWRCEKRWRELDDGSDKAPNVLTVRESLDKMVIEPEARFRFFHASGNGE